jgi:hypothetical protein
LFFLLSQALKALYKEWHEPEKSAQKSFYEFLLFLGECLSRRSHINVAQVLPKHSRQEHLRLQVIAFLTALVL